MKKQIGPKLTEDNHWLPEGFQDCRVYAKLIDRMGSSVFLLANDAPSGFPTQKPKLAWLVCYSGYISREERSAGATFNAPWGTGPIMMNAREACRLITFLQNFVSFSEEQDEEVKTIDTNNTEKQLGPKLTEDSPRLLRTGAADKYAQNPIYGKLIDKMGSSAFLWSDYGPWIPPRERSKFAWLVCYSSHVTDEERLAGTSFNTQRGFQKRFEPILMNAKNARELITILQDFISFSEEQKKLRETKRKLKELEHAKRS
jgi:hypothetical protein